MDSLIKVSVDENNEQVVSCREIYNFLNISDRYSRWFEDSPRILVTSVMS